MSYVKIHKAINESRKRETLAKKMEASRRRCDHEKTHGAYCMVRGCPNAGFTNFEPRFREALAVSLEVFELAPKECACTPKWICPHCLLKAAIASIDRILAGECASMQKEKK